MIIEEGQPFISKFGSPKNLYRTYLRRVLWVEMKFRSYANNIIPQKIRLPFFPGNNKDDKNKFRFRTSTTVRILGEKDRYHHGSTTGLGDRLKYHILSIQTPIKHYLAAGQGQIEFVKKSHLNFPRGAPCNGKPLRSSTFRPPQISWTLLAWHS